MHRKITRQSRWNVRRASIHVEEGVVRLSSKGESDRITQRSAVQIRPPQPRTPPPQRSGIRHFPKHRSLVGGMITSTIHVLILVPVFFVLMKERSLRRGTLQ